MDRIMQVLNIPYAPDQGSSGYYIRAHNGKISFTPFHDVYIDRISFYFSDETYLPGRCAQIVKDGRVVGIMGVLHPEVITNYELTQPCSAMEINLQAF